ncbi:radical SAM/SPASM domain-containing protein [Flavobacterium sp. PL02]|uniref:radical SAM/SPASM domain-containing protein n=1 Tax=Flavobacterium sp. PL02 TaxID=3088354 RepID=UPI002B22E9D9|nr:radical SAM protein [Flavobacterium sp. PL02]MEA9415081.1 radical SAM protein [Flavobacterium sp. PL02]
MKYKLSYYTIITDPIPNTNVCVIFGTKTSKAYNLDQKIIALLKEEDFDEIPLDIINNLIIAEIIVPKDLNELSEFCEKAKLDATAEDGYLHVTVMSSGNCQLGCSYCGQVHSKKKLEDDTVELIEKRLTHLFSSKPFSEFRISWFGGEPLMALNKMRLVNTFAKKISKSNDAIYRSHIVTNGLSLKSNIYEELAHEFNCTSIEITLDGVKEFHDTRRDTKAKEPTFDLIFNNILSITSLKDYPINGCYIKIRCNVDDTNKEGVIPLIELLAENNLQDKVIFYTAPVYSWGNDAHLTNTKEEYAINEIDYLLKLHEVGFEINSIPQTKDVVCSAVTPNYELIDPNGKIFNCTEIPLVSMYGDEYLIGDLKTSFTEVKEYAERPYTKWYDEIQDKSNGYWCTSCKILPLCGGRCPKSWKDGIPPCPSMKLNIEDRLMLANYLIQEDNITQIA